MAPPLPPRRSLPKEKFSTYLSSQKTTTYHDPSTRGPGSHTIRTIAWNPTGHLIATGSSDRVLRIWNPEKPNVKFSTELRGHTGAVERVAWNPSKEGELCSVSNDGTARFWDVRTGRVVRSVALGGEGLTVAWQGDGEGLIVGRKDDTLIPISLPDYVAGTPLAQTLQTNQITFPHTHEKSPASILLTTGDGSVKILSYPGFESLHTLHAHTSACFSLELSPNGRYLATGGSDALICLWDTNEWVCRRTLSGMVGAVRGLGFSWDGSYIVGGSDEGNGLEIAHVETGEYVHTIPTTAPAPCIAWHPSRYWLAYSGDPMGLKIVGAGGANA